MKPSCRRHVCTVLLFCALLLFAGAGCETLPWGQVPRFKVEPSPLNEVVLYYSPPATPEGTPGKLIRLELSGYGHLQYATGLSPRVLDPFWKQSSDAQWGDLRTDQIVLTQEEAAAYMQRLVDAGCYDLKQHKISPGHGIVKIALRINGRFKSLASTDPEVLKVFRELAEKF
jgi:hypothetical protein